MRQVDKNHRQNDFQENAALLTLEHKPPRNSSYCTSAPTFNTTCWVPKAQDHTYNDLVLFNYTINFHTKKDRLMLRH